MDLRNFFYDQLVAEDELDEVESLVEKAIGKILEDWGFEQYLMKYLKPTETGTPDMYIHVAANAAYVKESVAITHLVPVRWATTQDINCALDYLSASTIPSAGNKRYISVFAKFVRDESNQKIDGHSNPIWYDRDEGFEIEVWSGVEAPSPSKLALKSETYVLLFDVLLDENSTAISEPADWDNPVVDEIDISRVLYSEQVLKKASSQTIDSVLDFLKSIKVDTIIESTTDNGVDIETVNMKDGVIKVLDTTESTDKDTGSIITEGGIGVEKSLNVGGDVDVVGNLRATGDFETTNIKDYSETVYAHGDAGAAETIDLDDGNIHTLTLSADCTLTFVDPPASGKAGSLTLIVTQNGTGGWTITFSASVKWADDATPPIGESANKVTILTFVTINAGTRWYGFVSGTEFTA